MLETPRLLGSNLAEVNGFVSGCKTPQHKFSGRDFKPGSLVCSLNDLKSEKIDFRAKLNWLIQILDGT